MSTVSECSISGWLAGLKAGESLAIDRLWNHYSQQLVALARHKLRHAPKGAADEDDIALSVFRQVCRGAEEGRLQDLRTRDDLWWLLLTTANRKVIDHIRRETRQKRGGDMQRIDAAVLNGDADPSRWLHSLVSDEPTPELAAAFAEEYQRLLAGLPSDQLREIAIARIEGYSVEEIADRLGVSVRTIERKLQLIRKSWAADLFHGD